MDGYTQLGAGDDRLAMMVSDAEAAIDAQHGFMALAVQRAAGLVGVASGLAGGGAALVAWALTTSGVSALAVAGVTAAGGFSFAAHCVIRACECHDRFEAPYWPVTLQSDEHDEPDLKGKFDALRKRMESNGSHLQACSAMCHRALIALGWTPAIATLVSAAAWLTLMK